MNKRIHIIIAAILTLSALSCSKEAKDHVYSLLCDDENVSAVDNHFRISGEVVVMPAVDGVAVTELEGFETFKFTVVVGGDLVEVSKTDEGLCRIVPVANGDVSIKFEYYDKDGFQRIKETVVVEVRMSFATLGLERIRVSSAIYHDVNNKCYNFVMTSPDVVLTPAFDWKEGEMFAFMIPESIIGRELSFGKDNFDTENCKFRIAEAGEGGLVAVAESDFFKSGKCMISYDVTDGLFELDLDAVSIEVVEDKEIEAESHIAVSAYPKPLEGFIWFGEATSPSMRRIFSTPIF